jgi:hypothetical protein
VDNYRGDGGRRRLGADSAARRHRLGFVKPSYRTVKVAERRRVFGRVAEASSVFFVSW